MSRARVQRRPHAAHRADEIGQALEREVLAMQRNHDGIGSDERIEREQAERRWAVDEDLIEPRAKRVEHPAEAPLAVRAY